MSAGRGRIVATGIAQTRGELVKIVADQDVVEFICAHGGRLYVWADLKRCTGSRCSFFTASVDHPEKPHQFGRFGGGDFELLFSDEGLEAPEELRIELAGWWKKRVSVSEGFSWLITRDPPQGP